MVMRRVVRHTAGRAAAPRPAVGRGSTAAPHDGGGGDGGGDRPCHRDAKVDGSGWTFVRDTGGGDSGGVGWVYVQDARSGGGGGGGGGRAPLACQAARAARGTVRRECGTKP